MTEAGPTSERITVPRTLPPLPDFGGATAGLPAGRDIAVVVTAEHRRLESLCAQLADPAGPSDRRRRVAQVVTAMLARHLSAEEQYLYPAVRVAVPGGERLADREVAEDRAILVALQQLTAADDGDLDRLADSVVVQLRRHTASAEAELLPLLGQMVSAEELVRLGNRFELAREAAPTRPHPTTPATPPWNKIVDPTVGVVDKLRDAVSRRATYAEDL